MYNLSDAKFVDNGLIDSLYLSQIAYNTMATSFE